MPTNYTPNYQLSQWEPGDAVKRVDFNEDNVKLDAAIKAADQRIDSLSSTVSSHTSSLSGHTASISRLGNCQIYTTEFTGDGAASKTFSFPGYPVLVYIRNPAADKPFLFLRGMLDSMANTYSAAWSSRSLGLSYSSGGSAPFNYSGTKFSVLALLDMSK